MAHKKTEQAAHIDGMADDEFLSHLSELPSLPDTLQQSYLKRVNRMGAKYTDGMRALMRLTEKGEQKTTGKSF